MILSDFVLPSRINQRWIYSGMDSPDKCFDKTHFNNYPYQITYEYNSRGFRDAEWPESIDELKECIWCVGDSFTVGVGSPIHHTWVNILEKETGCRCINVSMDGASNQWISRKVKRIVEEIEPKLVVIQWSYITRGEKEDESLSDEQRKIMDVQLKSIYEYQVRFVNNVNNLTAFLKNKNTTIIYSSIPNFGIIQQHDVKFKLNNLWDRVKDSSWPSVPTNLYELEKLPHFIKHELKNQHRVYDRILSYLDDLEFYINNKKLLKNIPAYIYVQQIDYARDYHHYDIKTAQWLVSNICQQI